MKPVFDNKASDALFTSFSSGPFDHKLRPKAILIRHIYFFVFSLFWSSLFSLSLSCEIYVLFQTFFCLFFIRPFFFYFIINLSLSFFSQLLCGVLVCMILFPRIFLTVVIFPTILGNGRIWEGGKLNDLELIGNTARCIKRSISMIYVAAGWRAKVTPQLLRVMVQ